MKTAMTRTLYTALLLSLFFIPGLSLGQNSNASRLSQIDTEISQAVEAENYQKAAALKAEKKLRMELKSALKEENYSRAAEIQNQLKSGKTSAPGSDNEDKIAALNKELQAAIDTEDYVKAGQIKKQIEAVEKGEPTPAVASANSSHASPPILGEPEFVNQVYYKTSSGALKPLEKAEGKLVTSGGGWGGYSSATSSYMLGGSDSPVRLGGPSPRFVVKVFQGIDPSSQFKLMKMEIRGRQENRYADAYKSTSAVFHSESGAVSENIISVRFKSLGNHVYEIIPKKPLEPGEYTFMYITKMFAFGID